MFRKATESARRICSTSSRSATCAIADQYRERLVALYGQERGGKVRYAEAFQLGQYGRQASIDELKKMFPTLH